MSRPISDAWFHRIKAATRDLVKACGGVVRSGDVASASKSEVSRWQSPVDNDVITVPAILALEADCGVPYITRTLAELNGARIEGEAPVCLAQVMTRHADVMQAFSGFVGASSEAFGDLHLTPAEAERLERALSEVRRVSEPMLEALAKTKAAGGVQATAARFQAVR